MINDLLPRYYEAHGKDVTFAIIRSEVIGGHEVAWMEYRGTIICDMSGQGREGQPFVGRELYCECNFAEGVGWRIDPKYGLVNIHRSDECPHRQAFISMCREKIKKDLISRFGEPLKDHIPEVIMALIDLVKAGECLEDGSGASFWGGYFYIHTVAQIADFQDPTIWEIANTLVAEKKIGLEGAVVTDYFDPPPPEWSESFRIEKAGWIGIASLPAHHQMEQCWKLEVLKPDGSITDHDIPKIPLIHPSDFGPDIEDLWRAELALEKFLSDISSA